MPDPQHLFVYGTLRRAFDHDHARILRAHCRFLSAGAIAGRLYDLGSYPAAIADPTGSSKVRGELYRMIRPQLLFQILDRFEGCGADAKRPTLYRRERVEVHPHTGRPLMAWAYLYDRDPGGLRPIAHGDYALYRGSARKHGRR